MISIIKTTREVGVVIYDDKNGKFLHGERCDDHRMVSLVNAFPTNKVEIVVDYEYPEVTDDIFSHLPHLEVLAQVKKVKELSVGNYLINASKVKRKTNKSKTLIYAATGIILGCAILIPTSKEYKSSVLEQAKVMQEYTEEQASGNAGSEQLAKAIEGLHGTYKVDAVVSNYDGYKIVLTASSADLTIDDFGDFPNAGLTKEMSLVNDEGEEVHIYRLEGTL